MDGIITPQDVPVGEQRALHQYRRWRYFHDANSESPRPLLSALGRYPGCVLVAGCQRSGTTMLTRLIARTAAFRRFSLTHDDELDAALILAGDVSIPAGPRYCFQTTYLNQHFTEYAGLRPDQRLIWVLRNPRSVVHSMLYNWRSYGLNQLYESCVSAPRVAPGQRLRLWAMGLARVDKACAAYAAKTGQILQIRNLVPDKQLLVIDYDELVGAPAIWLERVFNFLGAHYDKAYAATIRTDSVRKAERLSRRALRYVERHAEPTYRACLRLVAR